MLTPALKRLLAGLMAATALGAASAHAQTEGQVSDQAQTAIAAKKQLNLLVVPLPVVDPALGNGAVLATAAFYSPVQGGRQWITGLGGLYTSNKDWAVMVLQQADLMNGKLRLGAAAGYGEFNLDFFGIGQSAGSQGRSIRIKEKGEVFIFNGLYNIRGGFYGGLRFRYLDQTTSLAEPLFPDHPLIPDAQFGTRISGLGPAIDYDTRDQEFTPKKGVFVSGQWLFDSPSLGSSFTYNKLTLAGNLYHSLNAKTVVAVRGSICNSTSAPFYDLCFFGSDHDLRGYEGGRYRDHSMYAVQAEIRRDLFWRFGATAFVGLGGVASSFSSFGNADMLPAAGVGLRFQPSKKIPVNISVDYAAGKDGSGLYIYMGEAF